MEKFARYDFVVDVRLVIIQQFECSHVVNATDITGKCCVKYHC